MRVNYKVHSSTESKVKVNATFNGRAVEAEITGLVVELVSECDTMGHTFRFLPDDVDAARALFSVGNTVAADFTLLAAAVAGEAEAPVEGEVN